MRIVIEISDNKYQWIKDNPLTYDNEYCEAIRKGTPLPKGHGDLVDRDAINSRFYDIWNELECYSNQPTYKELLDKWGVCMDTAPTIIEADKAESEEA